MPPVRRIFYISRSLAQDHEVEWILAGARSANERRGITGLLFYTGGHFAQLFEGEPADVHATMADIVADRRHDRIVTLLECDADARLCEGWRMAFLGAPGADALLAELHRAHPLPRERVDRVLALLLREAGEGLFTLNACPRR